MSKVKMVYNPQEGTDHEGGAEGARVFPSWHQWNVDELGSCAYIFFERSSTVRNILVSPPFRRAPTNIEWPVMRSDPVIGRTVHNLSPNLVTSGRPSSM